MFEIKPPAAWELRLLTAAQLIQPILDTPSLEGAAVRLAQRGFDIMQNAGEQALLGEMEIESAYRRLRGQQRVTARSKT